MVLERIDGSASWLGRGLKAGARIAFDRAAEAVGHALPRTIEQTCHPERIEALLTLGAPAGGPALPPLERASAREDVLEGWSS